MKLILASTNPAKLVEMRHVLSDPSLEIVPMQEAGVTEEIVEDGKTFEENAIKKAKEVSTLTHEWTIAEDSGVVIPALSGEPGVNSKHWAGENASIKQMVDYTLEKMKNIPKGKRQMLGESAVALCHPNGSYRTFLATNSGTVPFEPKGEMRDGMPYHLIFIPDGFTKTLAETGGHFEARREALTKALTFLKNEVLKGIK
jgi:XTP/dITP diphosphohydrolase